MLRATLIGVLVVIAAAHSFFFGYWMLRFGLPLTLSHLGVRSSQEIFEQHDPYRVVRSFLRERMLRGQIESIVLVGEQVSPPSRFDLEVYYELYPYQPTKVAMGSPELEQLLREASAGGAFISVVPLAVQESAYSLEQNDDTYIYVRR